jgi:hypothetical protein
MTASLNQPSSPDTQDHDAPSLSQDTELARATEAYIALVSARSLLHRLQRDAVLGMADDDALDTAVMAYRRARSVAARWRLPEPPVQPSSAQRFAGWLTETLHPTEMQTAA